MKTGDRKERKGGGGGWGGGVGGSNARTALVDRKNRNKHVSPLKKKTEKERTPAQKGSQERTEVGKKFTPVGKRNQWGCPDPRPTRLEKGKKGKGSTESERTRKPLGLRRGASCVLLQGRNQK